jgi:hypothetical protein
VGISHGGVGRGREGVGVGYNRVTGGWGGCGFRLWESYEKRGCEVKENDVRHVGE